MPRLSDSEIQELYAFTRKHNVVYFDLQTELVDHLANSIEEQMFLDSQISFNEALNKEYKKFGVFGFLDVVEKKRKAMSLRYWKVVLGFMKTYFKPPKILLVFSFIFALTMIFKAINIEHRYNVYFSLLLIISFGVLTFRFISDKKYNKETLNNSKQWLLKEQIYSFCNYVHIINLIPIMLNLTFVSDLIAAKLMFEELFFAILITTLMMLSYIIIFVVPQKAEKLLEETYPEYKLITKN